MALGRVWMPTHFKNMTLAQVYARGGSEGPVQRGKPLYFNRPWTQLHDEMLETNADRVRDLPDSRVEALRAATGSRD